MAIALYVLLLIPAYLIHHVNLIDVVEIDLLEIALIVLSLFVYLVLHELTHGVTMKCFGGKEVKFGFTGLYAYAGSEKDYFLANSYIVIALAPFVLWTLVFTILLICLRNLYWPLAILQIVNISGCAGDLYVSYLISRFPADSYIRDTGVEMRVYNRKE